MTNNILRISRMAAFALAALPAMLCAQGTAGLEGVWNVHVTVVSCTDGSLIRKVQSIQGFSRDGSESETANTAARGSSVGVWAPAGGQNFNAQYWFFRYNPDGTFKSMAQVLDSITLTGVGQFTSSGTVTDYDANGNVLTVGCFTHTATQIIPLH